MLGYALFFEQMTACSITGLLTIGIIGLGRLLVRGLRRVPSPPAIIIAFMWSPSFRFFYMRVMS